MMTPLSLILILLLTTGSFASEYTLTFDEINKRQFKSKRSKRKSNPKSVNYKKELDKVTKKLEAYRYISRMQRKRPIIMFSHQINEADLIGAKTTQRIMATSSISEVVLSELRGADLPKNSKIVCQVYAKFKRVCGECNRIIIDGKGYDIKGSLYNKDGSQCAIGKVSDDKEKYLTGIFISEMAQGAMALSQSSIPTVGGNLIRNSASNKISQGLINTGGELTSLMKDEYKTSESIVTLKNRSKVIVYFKKEFSL